MRVGGEAAVLVLPSCIEEIREAVKALKKANVPHAVIGNGTNLIVSDSGFSGVIIKLADNFSNISVAED